MEIKIYDRKTKEVVIEKQYKEGHLKFLYNTVIGRVLLKYIFARKYFSGIYAKFMISKRSVKKIKPFIEKFNIDMNEYEGAEYKSFNDFFIRKRTYLAPLPQLSNNILISVADAKLSVYSINDELKINIKNSIYTVSSLVRDEKIADGYRNGTCLVFRLTVDDCHRYLYIDDGHVKSHKSIAGVLHTVGPISSYRHNVYIENQREVSVLETENIGDFVQIEIGAILVGKIINHPVTSFKRGDEKGYFSFGGSTIVLLFKEGAVKVDDDILGFSKKGIETKVRQGEKIGEIVK